MKEFPVRINTEYLENQKRKKENEKLLRLAGAAVIVGVTSPEWFPVLVKWGSEVYKILSVGNLVH